MPLVLKVYILPNWRFSVIVIVGTLDTKGDKTAYLKQVIESKGAETFVIDCGVLGEPLFEADIPREKVAEAAGSSISELNSLGSEAEAIRIMARGTSKVVAELYAADRLDGLLGVGGTMGTSLFLTAANVLPIGVPKAIFSTTAFSPYLRPELVPPDLIVIPAISDIWGLDDLTRRSLENAAGTILGSSSLYRESKDLRGRTFIGITTVGTSGLKYIVWLKPLLEERGNQVVAFHVGGGQGWSFERLIRQGLIKGVLDLCIIDFCPPSLTKWGFLSMAKRLESAGERGIPQIVTPGSVCEIAWPKSLDELPARFKKRKARQHNDLVWALERSLNEVAQTAELIAAKMNQGRGPRAIVVPKQGITEWDRPEQAFYNPKRIGVFTQALKANLSPEVELVELDLHINDQKFAEEVAKLYSSLVAR
jgi:uncharacterized protein (UPF0261 family)